jgi:hypothetical protein
MQDEEEMIKCAVIGIAALMAAIILIAILEVY